jgi:hypothetical protein
MTRTQYVAYLKSAINHLEDIYDESIGDLMFGRAIKVSGQIRDLRSKLRAQLGY